MKKSDNNIPNTADMPDISDVASSGECTGLMQTPPQSGAEYASYQELSGMQIPKITRRKKRS